jgi:hypothetical protein
MRAEISIKPGAAHRERFAALFADPNGPQEHMRVRVFIVAKTEVAAGWKSRAGGSGDAARAVHARRHRRPGARNATRAGEEPRRSAAPDRRPIERSSQPHPLSYRAGASSLGLVAKPSGSNGEGRELYSRMSG